MAAQPTRMANSSTAGAPQALYADNRQLIAELNGLCQQLQPASTKVAPQGERNARIQSK